MATSARGASRIRSLTLIEPVLPTLLHDNAADRRLSDVFADMGTRVHVDLWNGMYMEALDRFLEFWSGSGPRETLAGEARLRMIEVIEKVAFDFTAILAEENVASHAQALRVPTLLVSGGLSPYMTQRIVTRLAALIPGAETMHLPAAGHMLPITHAKMINPEIVRHIELAEDFANVLIASPCGVAGRNRSGQPHLRLVPG
jgi:pimeloyl-ACP methyl ester carboxylesterase